MKLIGFKKPPADTRVVVAMSGGVDSSTAAAFVAEEGYEVIGITLQLYNHGAMVKNKKACCAGQDVYDARRVAETIGIPHYVLDYENKFTEYVIDDFADSYLRGETPIPCIRCNQTVKFHDLLVTAQNLGADALVTGHYVQKVEGQFGPELHRGSDDEKDQSYFLFATKKEQLNFLHFPLGSLNKVETRRHAKRFGLPVFEKPDSQDICFIPTGSYTDFVKKIRPGVSNSGEIVDLDGNVLGYHDGIFGFTIGQRRGLGIAKGKPQYVIRIEAETSRVFIGPKESLLKERFYVNNINWLGDNEGLKKEIELEIKIRSSSIPEKATFIMRDDGIGEIIPDIPVSGVAPGQACVFYNDRRVLGGGWIVKEKGNGASS